MARHIAPGTGPVRILDVGSGPATNLGYRLPDGCVIVWGHVNEGEHERYRGYHQWNFCWEDDDPIIWRPGHRQSVRALLGEGLHFRSEGTDALYRIVISRRAIL